MCCDFGQHGWWHTICGHSLLFSFERTINVNLVDIDVFLYETINKYDIVG